MNKCISVYGEKDRKKEKEIDDFLILELGKNWVVIEFNCFIIIGVFFLLEVVVIIEVYEVVFRREGGKNGGCRDRW